MNKLFLFILITFFVAISLSAETPVVRLNNEQEFNLSYPQLNSVEEKIYGLSKVWSELEYNFVNIDQIKFDCDSLYRATIKKILATKNDIEYYDELQRFMAAFSDGHTEVIERSYNWSDYFDYIPMSIVDIDNKLYVSSIRKNVGLDSTLLGAEIIEIENMPTRDYVLKEIFPNISASTYNHRWYQSSSKIQQGIKGSYFNGKVCKRNGEICSFSIQRNGETTRTVTDEYWEAKKNQQSKNRVNLEWDNGIAILSIKAFQPDNVMTRIDSVAKLIQGKAKGLIIDLRYNGGGETPIADHLQMYLTTANSFLTFGAQIRINDGYGRSQGNYRDEYKDFYLNKAYKTEQPESLAVKSGIKPFGCPIVILIGKFSFSACEDFLVNIYDVPNRPLLIGESTGGSTGAPLLVPLPHDAMARLCTVRILYPYTMKPFVGNGIKPDIEVKQSIDDYLNGYDIVMAKAKEDLFKKDIEKSQSN